MAANNANIFAVSSSGTILVMKDRISGDESPLNSPTAAPGRVQISYEA